MEQREAFQAQGHPINQEKERTTLTIKDLLCTVSTSIPQDFNQINAIAMLIEETGLLPCAFE